MAWNRAGLAIHAKMARAHREGVSFPPRDNHVVKRNLLLVICLPVLMGASDPYGLTLREARRLRQEKRYEEAAQAYEAALELELCDPVLRDALFELATCYQAMGLWVDAIKTYRVILDDPRLDGR